MNNNILFVYLCFSYLANLCWDGGCVNFIILRRVKQKAPSPPCDVSATVATLEKHQPDQDGSKLGCDTLENHRQSREFGFISEPSSAQDNSGDLDCLGDRKSLVLTDSEGHGGTRTMPARVHSQVKKSHMDSFSRETPRQVSRQCCRIWRELYMYIKYSFSISPSPLYVSLLQPRNINYIWKMHIVKGQKPLGIQITGGRGSKRSHHGIIITHVEEGGVIDRYESYSKMLWVFFVFLLFFFNKYL